MVYKTFLNLIASHIQTILPDSCTVHLEQVQKNNGILLDGICIQTPNEAVSPTIYLNSFYEAYQNGQPLTSIYQEILNLYHRRGSFSALDIQLFQNFSYLKDKIIFRLIHASSNQTLLKTVPHIPYLDLAIVFCIYLTDDSSTQQMTALIRNSQLSVWNVSPARLQECAFQNTPRLFPPVIKSLAQTIQEFPSSIPLSESEASFSDIPFYVLSNPDNLYGSACICYPDIIKDFADSQKTDLLVLPSSIHEVLLTADSPDIDYEEFSQMVFEINQSEVSVEDRLSNQIYRYSRTNDSLSVVSHGPEPVGK